jgi:hypothetical protein
MGACQRARHGGRQQRERSCEARQEASIERHWAVSSVEGCATQVGSLRHLDRVGWHKTVRSSRPRGGRLCDRRPVVVDVRTRRGSRRALFRPASEGRDNGGVVSGVVLWDFDGTLAWRPGLWGGCVLEVLDEQAPGHTAELETVRSAMRAGFPWHDHARAAPRTLSDPEAWWRAVTAADRRRDPRLRGGGAGGGARARRSPALTSTATRGWRVFDDTRAALRIDGRRRLAQCGCSPITCPSSRALVAAARPATTSWSGSSARRARATRNRTRRPSVSSCAPCGSPAPPLDGRRQSRSPTSPAPRRSGYPRYWFAPTARARHTADDVGRPRRA